MSLVDDGTGPLYDRPSTPRTPAPITMESRRAPAEPTPYERYQALVADGATEEEARTTVWPEAALVYVEGEDGEQILLPPMEDGLTDLSGYEVDEVPEGSEVIDVSEIPSGTTVEIASAADAEGSPAAEDAEEAPTGAEDASDAQTGAEDPEEVAEVDAAETEIADGLDADDDAEPADEGFDPSNGTVAEVQAYLSDHPDQTRYVLDRERAGKARVSLIGA